MTDDGQGQDDARISAIRAAHYQWSPYGDDQFCPKCLDDNNESSWPCDYGYVLTRLDALAAERDRYRTEWEERDLAERYRTDRQVETFGRLVREKEAMRDERDDLAARLAAAEAALERQYAISDSMAAWLDGGDDACDAGNPDGGSAQTCNHCIVSGMLAEARDAGRQAEAALAGSRERAQGEGA